MIFIWPLPDLIDAFNSGNVPNEENNLLFKCKNKIYKDLEEAEQIYEKYLKDNLDNNKNPFKDFHKKAKDKALEYFNNKIKGDASNKYLKQLKSKIKEKYLFYLKIYEEKNNDSIIQKLNEWYTTLEQRINNNDFKSIDEISKDFISFEEKLNDLFQNYQRKNELFNEFKIKVFVFVGKQIEDGKKVLQEENNHLKETLALIKNEKENKNILKEQTIIFKDKNEKTITALTKENEQLKKKLERLEDDLNNIKKKSLVEKERFEKSNNKLKSTITDLEKKIKEKEAQHQKDIIQLNDLKNLTQEHNTKSGISKLESDLIEKTAQYEKDKLLWESKLKFIQQERDILKKENSESLKRFESILDTIQKKIMKKKQILKIK